MMISVEDRRKELQTLVRTMREKPSAEREEMRSRAWVLSRMMGVRPRA